MMWVGGVFLVCAVGLEGGGGGLVGRGGADLVVAPHPLTLGV